MPRLLAALYWGMGEVLCPVSGLGIPFPAMRAIPMTLRSSFTRVDFGHNSKHAFTRELVMKLFVCVSEICGPSSSPEVKQVLRDPLRARTAKWTSPPTHLQTIPQRMDLKKKVIGHPVWNSE
ncbi:hypothetical protein AVEN_35518-1 [Araneus ventricosus]|uniref:Uncharacterized protein n=1 Tax=Araneus ventricosus TaxID=182803 RepID=A0A4Y2GRS4_ARAVE|nr:hypothetical protein AVEN_35518-1 [Araneus ventricosus]